ncbi:unnamed protein product [Pleuronectes platessa]|uniref:Uncharacterized protein n=1 Tax=Pleuronectes platessa TaxID=8262 RepID=A0A9N7V2J9_PLEPL|nr:unnamed protein product [Pleuronectes platessa]
MGSFWARRMCVPPFPPVSVGVPCGRWEAIWHTSAQTDVAQHITASHKRDQKPQEHLDLWQPSPSANKLTSPSCLGPVRREGEESPARNVSHVPCDPSHGVFISSGMLTDR